MAHRKTDLPIYIYVKKEGSSKDFHFEGDFCEGRKPTQKEYEIFKKNGISLKDQIDIESSHFITGLKNPLYSIDIIKKATKHKSLFSFPSLESLIDRALEVYKSEGYTSGLILGFDGKNPHPDRVLIVSKGYAKTEDVFLKEAQDKKIWAKSYDNSIFV